MSFCDLVGLILENLGRRKARVALTAVGVVIGTAAVVVLVSLAIGLQRNATDQLGNIGDLTRVDVSPGSVDGGPGKPGLISESSVRPGGGGGGPGQQILITDESLRQFGALPGVTAVVPRD